MSKANWSGGDAPEGAVWVCPCCGKHDSNLQKLIKQRRKGGKNKKTRVGERFRI